MAILERVFTKAKYQATYYVEETEAGKRLDQFLQKYLESWSRQDVKKKIKDGDVNIVGRPGNHRPSTVLHYREKVILTVHKTTQEDEYWNGELIKLNESPDIIFEDDHLIVISKPPYMSTHPTGKHLFYCATVHFEEIHHKTIHSIHRLDRETSGVMMLAKDSKTSNAMSEEFINDRVKKCYFFMARKNEDFHGQSSFEANERLGAKEGGLKRVYINHYPKDSAEGKRAHTKFSIIAVEGDYVLGLAFPQTGRQHQIRVHAMINGLPLIGDKLYLGSFKMFQRFKDGIASKEDHDQMQLARHALHAISLKAKYNNEEVVFTSRIPEDFIKWIEKNFTISINEIEIRAQDEIEKYFKLND